MLDPVAADRVAHPHRGVRVLGTDREVLRHSLDEPERQPRDTRRGGAPAASLAGDVVLEGVHQLVTEHVVGLVQRPGERQHDVVLE
jgi:hypothetical protein